MYFVAAVAFAMSRLPRCSEYSRHLLSAAFALCAAALLVHARLLYTSVMPGDSIELSLSNALSLIGLQLALIGLLAAFEPELRGLVAGLLVLAALAALATGSQATVAEGASLTWQLEAHILISMFAYGLLSAGAIIAVYALIQDRRLRAGQLSAINHLFAPLETTEKLLYGVTAAGFAVLALAVVSGVTFVENLFAQHLVHKTILSLLALLLFGTLLAGRHFAGWRGKRAVYLYLGGFALLCLAYFGSRFVLEELLHRSWG